MDIKSPEERSKNMAAIHSKNTKPEIYLRKLLFARGYRYGVNSKSVPGHPDIYMKKYNTAIFVHGCFWHRHENCKYATTPATNTDFWINKFNTTVMRDKYEQNVLENAGWNVIIIWECEIKSSFDNVLAKTIELILLKSRCFYGPCGYAAKPITAKKIAGGAAALVPPKCKGFALAGK